MAKGVKKFSYQVLDEFQNQEGYPRTRPHLQELTVLQILHIHYLYAQFSNFSTCASSSLLGARRYDRPLTSLPSPLVGERKEFGGQSFVSAGKGAD
jgi:hypothetical protein